MEQVDRIAYEKMVEQRKKHHLAAIENAKMNHWRPCLHDECPLCWGTGVKLSGQPCVHNISCPCPKCSPHSMSMGVTYGAG